MQTNPDMGEIKSLVDQVIQIDIKHFGNQNERFVKDPVSELKYGLAILLDSPKHALRYEQFINPLVYHKSPASWNEAIASVEKAAKIWLGGYLD